ncbi:MAG: type I-E CRISPR-associated protein Cas5/CasD, partial [Acidimicrobiales bacterium]
FGVRADRPGEVLRDFHTVSSLFDERGRFDPAHGRLPTASGGYRSVATSTQVSERFYLSDACFVAGVEGEEGLLDELDRALARPVFAPYLGRRSCPPDAPLRLGIHRGTLLEVLGSLAWQGGGRVEREPSTVRCEVVVEDIDGDRELVDEVRSFDPVRRSYGRRRVRHHYLDVVNVASGSRAAGHDPMALVEED